VATLNLIAIVHDEEQHTDTKSKNRNKFWHSLFHLAQHEMEGRSVVPLDGGDPTGKVYHTSHQLLSSGVAPVLPRGRRRDGTG
jgi:hypothetical protein